MKIARQLTLVIERSNNNGSKDKRQTANESNRYERSQSGHAIEKTTAKIVGQATIHIYQQPSELLPQMIHQRIALTFKVFSKSVQESSSRNSVMETDIRE